MRDEPLNLSDIPSGTRVMAMCEGRMHPAVVVTPNVMEPALPGYISVSFEPPVPDGRPCGSTLRLSTNFPSSIKLGWSDEPPRITD